MDSEFQDVREQRGARTGGRPASFDVVLRRFFREVQQSRILSEVKKRRFHTKELSRKVKRQAARRKAAQKRARRGY